MLSIISHPQPSIGKLTGNFSGEIEFSVDDFLVFLPYAVAVRAYLTFQQRGGWSFHLLTADLRAPLTGWVRVAGDENTLLRTITRLNGSTESAKRNIRRWNRGREWVDFSPAQCRYFGIADRLS